MAHHFAELLDHVARTYEEQLAGFGQLDRRARTVDQLQAERLFQRAYPTTEGRLRDETALCRLGKAAGRCQSDEILQPLGFQIHLKIPSIRWRRARSHTNIMPFRHSPAGNGIGRQLPESLILGALQHCLRLPKPHYHHVRSCIIASRKRPAWHPSRSFRRLLRHPDPARIAQLPPLRRAVGALPETDRRPGDGQAGSGRCQP